MLKCCGLLTISEMKRIYHQSRWQPSVSTKFINVWVLMVYHSPASPPRPTLQRYLFPFLCRSSASWRQPQPREEVRRRVYFDSCLTKTAHVSQLSRSCFYQLRRIKTIRTLDLFIPTSTAIVLVNSFIVSWVDYCNSLLAGLLICQLARMQLVLNSAARLFITRHHLITLQICCETTHTGCVFLSVSPTSCAWSPTKQYIIACQTT